MYYKKMLLVCIMASLLIGLQIDFSSNENQSFLVSTQTIASLNGYQLMLGYGLRTKNLFTIRKNLLNKPSMGL